MYSFNSNLGLLFFLHFSGGERFLFYFGTRKGVPTLTIVNGLESRVLVRFRESLHSSRSRIERRIESNEDLYDCAVADEHTCISYTDC